jgi:hypothetical protein
MATYRMVYGDDEQVVRETFENIDDLQREDGWVVLFRGKEAILRVPGAARAVSRGGGWLAHRSVSREICPSRATS